MTSRKITLQVGSKILKSKTNDSKDNNTYDCNICRFAVEADDKAIGCEISLPPPLTVSPSFLSTLTVSQKWTRPMVYKERPTSVDSHTVPKTYEVPKTDEVGASFEESNWTWRGLLVNWKE